MQIIGFKSKVYDFEDKTGKHVHSEGVQLFCVYPLSSGDGHGCEAVYLNSDKLAGYRPQIGDQIEVTYNRYGKPAGVKVL